MFTPRQVFLFLVILSFHVSSAFLPNSPLHDYSTSRQSSVTKRRDGGGLMNTARQQQQQQLPVSLLRQRRSIGTVQTMGLFGLGAPEIAIILIAAAFVLGPEKLADLGKDAGKIAGELKEVPKEFQKGLEEGEIEARSRKAKPMDTAKIGGQDIKENTEK